MRSCSASPEAWLKKKKKEEKKNITELRENKDEPNIICMWRCN